jgi:hypothetical protein
MIKAFIKKKISPSVLDYAIVNRQRLILNFQNFVTNPPIIIYTMGKVASQTLQRSLKIANLHNPIYRVQYLSQDGIKTSENYYLSLNSSRVPRFIKIGKILRKKIEKDRDQVHWKIITLVREQISREISHFFQDAEFSHSYFNDNGKIITHRAIKILQDKFLNYDESTDHASTWFNKELRSVFGIDVYAYPFNHQKGFTIIRNKNVDVLILRAEDLDHTFNNAIPKFLDLDNPVRISKRNIGWKKSYSQEYRYVLQNIYIPKEICVNINNSRYAKHFYSEDMRNEFIHRWCGEQRKHTKKIIQLSPENPACGI